MRKFKIICIAFMFILIVPLLTSCKVFFDGTGEINGSLLLNVAVSTNQKSTYKYDLYGERRISEEKIEYSTIKIYLDVLKYVQMTNNTNYVGDRFKIEWSPYENADEVYTLKSENFKYNDNFTALIISIPFFRDLSNANIIEEVNGLKLKKLAEPFTENKLALKVVSIDYQSKEEDSLYKFSKIIDINNLLIKE